MQFIEIGLQPSSPLLVVWKATGVSLCDITSVSADQWGRGDFVPVKNYGARCESSLVLRLAIVVTMVTSCLPQLCSTV